VKTSREEFKPGEFISPPNGRKRENKKSLGKRRTFGKNPPCVNQNN